MGPTLGPVPGLRAGTPGTGSHLVCELFPDTASAAAAAGALTDAARPAFTGVRDAAISGAGLPLQPFFSRSAHSVP